MYTSVTHMQRAEVSLIRLPGCQFCPCGPLWARVSLFCQFSYAVSWDFYRGASDCFPTDKAPDETLGPSFHQQGSLLSTFAFFCSAHSHESLLKAWTFVLDIFTYSFWSAGRFSDPSNSSAYVYDAGSPGYISVKSGWGGKCSLWTMCLYWSVGMILASSWCGVD